MNSYARLSLSRSLFSLFLSLFLFLFFIFYLSFYIKVGSTGIEAESSGESSSSNNNNNNRVTPLNMKTELEELQRIIVDDTGKYPLFLSLFYPFLLFLNAFILLYFLLFDEWKRFTDKEKADANIKYERVHFSFLFFPPSFSLFNFFFFSFSFLTLSIFIFRPSKPTK